MSLTELTPPYRALLFRTLRQCLYSEDKLHVIRACETVAALCAKDANEAGLAEHINTQHDDQVCLLSHYCHRP